MLPVLVLGIVICLVSTRLITPPVMGFIQKRIDLELTLASRMGLQVCEKYLNYLLDLRLEDDREMNLALRREAMAEIKTLNSHFQSIHLLVIDGGGMVVGASEPSLEPSGEPPALEKRDNRIVRISLWGKPIRASHRYFPFWNWHVAGYIHEKDYQAPLILAKRVVYIGTFGVLAAVWLVLLIHDGYIDVTSTRSRGTTFDLYFPMTRDASEEGLERRSIPELTGCGETILVVDDVAEQREIATRILTRLGYRVDSVPSGEAAVEYVRTGRVDLLILDMIMDPGMDGLDTLRQILRIHPGQKAIVASGYSESARVREARRIGAVQYVKKPYTLECIGTAVKLELGST